MNEISGEGEMQALCQLYRNENSATIFVRKNHDEFFEDVATIKINRNKSIGILKKQFLTHVCRSLGFRPRGNWVERHWGWERCFKDRLA